MPFHADPITRNRKERRLAWLLFVLLLAAAAIIGRPGVPTIGGGEAPVEKPAEAP